LISLILTNCTAFSKLPVKTNELLSIGGLYSNDSDSSNHWEKENLWTFIDSKYYSQEKGLLVKIEIVSENRLNAKLLRQNEIIVEKSFKGKTKKDNCFYSRRIFYFVPILPVLWFFKDEQKRIYLVDNTLIFEKVFYSGGAFIIMAGGDNGYHKNYYKRIDGL
jgi:hypothetical protein